MILAILLFTVHHARAQADTETVRVGMQTGLNVVPFTAAWGGSTGWGASIHAAGEITRPGWGRLRAEMGFGSIHGLALRYVERTLIWRANAFESYTQFEEFSGYGYWDFVIVSSPDALRWRGVRIGLGLRFQRMGRIETNTLVDSRSFSTRIDVLPTLQNTGLRELEIFTNEAFSGFRRRSTADIGPRYTIYTGLVRLERDLGDQAEVYVEIGRDLNRRLQNIPFAEDRRFWAYALGVRYWIKSF